MPTSRGCEAEKDWRKNTEDVSRTNGLFVGDKPTLRFLGVITGNGGWATRIPRRYLLTT